MKPMRLEISGWGPYKDVEVIDFTALNERGLFLITGPTGAGKTTIFDAVSFAIYGNMSGQTREKNSVRSDFSGQDTKTYVELTMQHKGERYKIYRNPEYLRPKKRKTGKEDYTKEKENAVLTLPDGSCLEGSLEVTKKMQEILCFDYRQFKQISMIAQGEFVKLLTETPAEKMKIFRELFGTEELEKFTSALKTKANRLYKEVMEYRHRMDEDVNLLHEKREEWLQLIQKEDRNYEEIFLFLEQLKKEYKEESLLAKQECEKAEKEEKKRTKQLSDIRLTNEKLEMLAKKKEQLSALKEKREEYKEKEKEAAGIQKAQLVEPAYIHLKNIEEQLEKQEEKQRKLQQEKERIYQELKENTLFYEKKDLLFSYMETVTEEKQRKEERKEYDAALREKRQEQTRLKEEYLEAEEKARQAREQLEEAEEAYRRSAVGIVAKMLKREEPCPVCGSKEHPRPAQTGGEAIDGKQLKSLRKKYETLQENMLKVHEKVLGIQAEERTLLTRLNEGLTCGEELEQRKSVQEKQIREGNEKEIQIWLASKPEEQRRKLEKELEKYQKNKALLAEKEENERNAGAEITQLSSQRTELFAAYKQALLKQEIEKESLFLTLLKRKEEGSALLAECAKYKEQTVSLTDLVNHLKEEVKGKKQANARELEIRLQECGEKRKEASDRQMKQGQKLLEVQKIAHMLKEKQERMNTLSKEYGIVRDLDNLASGNNAKRLVFEQYVLAVYFEQILEAANLRFSKMTAGRYEMFRSEEVTDGRSKDSLEIKVLDQYTGKARSVKTLSGGEMFKASLSLALGLSDVIGRNNGGIRVETLFIDEGFGALDNESLDQACETLISLVEKDRLIGIISHVPELRERIDGQIVVKKTNSGSKIENVLA